MPSFRNAQVWRQHRAARVPSLPFLSQPPPARPPPLPHTNKCTGYAAGNICLPCHPGVVPECASCLRRVQVRHAISPPFFLAQAMLSWLDPASLSLSLSLSLTHTHTHLSLSRSLSLSHTHTHTHHAHARTHTRTRARTRTRAHNRPPPRAATWCRCSR
jgi:hypothetical protein